MNIRRLCWLLVMLALAVPASGYAQTASLTVVGIIQSETALSDIALTADGEVLVAADRDENTLRIFDISRPDAVEERETIALEGRPTAMVTTQTTLSGSRVRVALVAVLMADGSGSVEVIGLDGEGLINILDVAPDPRSISVGSNGRWAVVVSDPGVAIMEIFAADDINSFIYEEFTQTVFGAAVAPDTAYFVRAGSTLIESLILRGNAPQAGETVSLESTATVISLNGDATLGVATQNGQLAFFDPNARQVTSIFALDDDSPLDMAFGRLGNTTVLYVGQANGTLNVVDVSDPANPASVFAQELDIRLARLDAAGELLAVTDGRQVALISGS